MGYMTQSFTLSLVNNFFLDSRRDSDNDESGKKKKGK